MIAILIKSNDRTKVKFPIVNGSNENREDEVDDTIEDDHSIEDRDENQAPDLQIAAKRGRGRPRRIMTELRGRPKNSIKL